jgi:hypothetical protein
MVAGGRRSICGFLASLRAQIAALHNEAQRLILETKS